MNVRCNTFELTCEGHQVSEVVSALLHSIIFYRTHGKFQYKHEGSYSIGTLGYQEVSCDLIDFSYMQVASPQLVANVNADIKHFVENLRQSGPQSVGTINLEFYSKRRGRWPFNETPLVWEIWTLKVNVEKEKSGGFGSGELGEKKVRVEEMLLEKLLTMIQLINNSKCYLPQMPNQQYVDTIFDTTLRDAQPYLHQISYSVANNVLKSPINEVGPSFAFKKIIKETLSM